MADDYTPTTEVVRGRHNANATLDSRTWRMADAEFDRWLAAHDAEKRAEWEGEQGETEWGMGYWTGRGALFVDEAVNEEDAHFRVEHSIVYDFVVSRQATPWLPIPDTASESREERSPAGDPAPHWAVISAGNIVIAQGYCWCNDPNGGYHQIGIKPAPVPDTTNHEIRRQS